MTRWSELAARWRGHDEGQLCRCVTRHRPTPNELDRHHVLPLSMGGTDEPGNVVWLCPTAHRNVHECLRLLVARSGSLPTDLARRYSTFTKGLAHEGWRRYAAALEETKP